jgi:hypothetical protein
MDDPTDAGEILARAAGYPYEAPLRSFVQRGAAAHELGGEAPDLSRRRPLLCYGANAAPVVLARKLAGLPPEPLPLLRAELEDFDVVYSAHVSPYGAVPATLQVSAGTVAPVFVAYPTAAQERALTATEPNYELSTLRGAGLRVDRVGVLDAVDVYFSRHGCLALDGSEVALAAVASANRRLPALDEVEVLERVRHILAPELDLAAFVASGLDPGLAAARTAVLRGGARPLRNSQVFFER